MVTSHPLPEGFTEIEVFAIGTALLVEGKLSLGPQQQQKKKKKIKIFASIIPRVVDGN